VVSSPTSTVQYSHPVVFDNIKKLALSIVDVGKIINTLLSFTKNEPKRSVESIERPID
jgi:hypothetical protein